MLILAPTSEDIRYAQQIPVETKLKLVKVYEANMTQSQNENKLKKRPINL